MARNRRFQTERIPSNDQYLHVHVADKGTVVIKDEDEGIVIDVYPFKDLSGGAHASVYAFTHELAPEDGSTPAADPANEWQKTAAEAYACGDFAHIADITDPGPRRRELADCGDSLFRFIFSELSSSEDCDTPEEAIRRLDTARRDIEQVIDALSARHIPRRTDAAPDQYRVTWRIDLHAGNPREAAQRALAMHRDLSSTATHFDVVHEATGKHTSVDLGMPEPNTAEAQPSDQSVPA